MKESFKIGVGEGEDKRDVELEIELDDNANINVYLDGKKIFRDCWVESFDDLCAEMLKRWSSRYKVTENGAVK